MGLNDILDDGDRLRREAQATLAGRTRAAEEWLRKLLESARTSLTEALQDTEGLGDVTVRAGHMKRRVEQLSLPIVVQSAGERLEVLAEGEIAWTLGQSVGEIGRGSATPLQVLVWRRDRSFRVEEKFLFRIAPAGPLQGNYPVQRAAFQAQLEEAVRRLK